MSDNKIMARFKTEQEAFWAGEFGSDYCERNRGSALMASNQALLARILSRTAGVGSVIEFGANMGLNLQCIRTLLPLAELAAVEINSHAVSELQKIQGLEIFSGSILEFSPRRSYDLVLTKGVLIHLEPASLEAAYDVMYKSCSRYICVAEYYNPTPVTVTYRGHDNRLYKRDFAGELLDRIKNMQLID